MATSCTDESPEITVYETSESGNKLTQVTDFKALENPTSITLDTSKEFQTISGFGGAFTESSAYLLNRGIKRFGSSLRYHPTVFVRIGSGENAELEKHPALLGKITNNEGIITGVARTFLNPVTKKLAEMENPKRVLGQLHGNAIRFGSGPYPEDLIAGEGLENVLSVGTALPKSDLASCLTANHLGMFIPPQSILRLWIARDNDKAGEAASDRLRERAEKAGLWVGDLVPKLEDFNKDLQEHGVDRLHAHLENSMKEQLAG